MNLKSFRFFLVVAFSFSFSAFLLTMMIIGTGLGFESNPFQAFFLDTMGNFAILEVVFGWFIVIMVYERVSVKFPKAIFYSAILLSIMFFIDFLNDLIILLSP